MPVETQAVLAMIGSAQDQVNLTTEVNNSLIQSLRPTSRVN